MICQSLKLSSKFHIKDNFIIKVIWFTVANLLIKHVEGNILEKLIIESRKKIIGHNKRDKNLPLPLRCFKVLRNNYGSALT